MDAAVVTEGRMALVWGSQGEPHSIGFEREPAWAGDSGFSVLLADSDEVVGPEDLRLVCLECLVSEYPKIDRGLYIAREYGVADLDDDGEWIVGDLSRLERD